MRHIRGRLSSDLVKQQCVCWHSMCWYSTCVGAYVCWYSTCIDTVSVLVQYVCVGTVLVLVQYMYWYSTCVGTLRASVRTCVSAWSGLDGVAPGSEGGPSVTTQPGVDVHVQL